MSRTADSFVIRPMQVADVSHVSAISGDLPSAPHWPDDVYIRALDASSLPCRIALVASSGHPGTILGFAVASLLPPQAELETIAVSAASQRQGAGRRLFSELARQLVAAGVTELLLEVRASNLAATRFYRSLGFTETGLRPRYYTDPIEDALLLRVRF